MKACHTKKVMYFTAYILLSTTFFYFQSNVLMENINFIKAK